MGRKKADAPDTKDLLIDAAGRGFRSGGFGGSGVDGLAKRAGLTSGAFYSQFGSKAEAFRVSVEHGLDFLLSGVETFQNAHGDAWLEPFVEFYLGARMDVELEEACALPTFAADVGRADEKTRRVFEDGFKKVTTAISQGLEGGNREERALALLAVLAGAASVARAVPQDADIRERILIAAKAAALAV
jgi:AcrR family transcriptional regulator